jgi:hypothetical protein
MSGNGRVEVGPDQDPVLAVGMPLDDQVFHVHRLSGPAIANLKRLPGHGRTGRAKVVDEQRPLLRHRIRTARAGAEPADRLQMLQRPVARKSRRLLGTEQRGGQRQRGDEHPHQRDWIHVHGHEIASGVPPIVTESPAQPRAPLDRGSHPQAACREKVC